ncbi:MAG: RidA family protein [Hyphomicrobiales bacterium]
MERKAIVPQELESYYTDWKMSPGLISGQHIFFTGFTGANPDGSLSSDPETQMRNAFEKIGFVLRDANLDFGSLVEMTTYHVGLRDHLNTFKLVREDYVKEPYPAWTAIEVAGFVREGAVIEIRVVAATE